MKKACKPPHLKTYQGREALRIATHNIMVLDTKQQDYGPKNISTFGEFGCLVRCSDKLERLKHLLSDQGCRVNHEAIEDTWMDLANYAIIATMCRRGIWEPAKETSEQSTNHTQKHKAGLSKTRRHLHQ